MKLALLPGLGADQRMYAPAYDGLAQEVVRVEWPAHDGESTLGEMAERLLAEYDLTDCDAIAGSSLGGMVASEIVERSPIPILLLIGSAQHPREINPLLAGLAKLRKRVPLELLQRLLGADVVASREPILEMIAEADPDQVRAMAGAIFAWEGREQTRARRRRLHGTWDLVIFPPKAGASMLSRAGHMIAMTHQAEVLAFLREGLEG